MSDSEAIMWAVEKDPALRSDFCNLTILESPPDPGRLRSKIISAADAVDRLHQRVITPPLRIAPPEWVDDPALDVDYHLRHVAAPAPGGTRELLDLAASLAETPLDRSRPLWEFTLIEGLADGRAALLQKVHHAVTDGVGGLRLSMHTVDLEPDPPGAATVAEDIRAELGAQHRTEAAANPLAHRSPLDVTRGAVADGIARRAALTRRAVVGAAHLASHPGDVPSVGRDVARLVASLRRQLLVAGRGRSGAFTSRSVRRHFEVRSYPLGPAKGAAHALGGSVNDLFVTGVAGALGLYHDRMGHPCDALRMGMPVNLRHREERVGVSNRFGPVRVVVPVGPKDPAARFDAVRERLAGTKQEPALGLVEELAGLVSGLPTSVLVALTRSQARTIDFITSNLRGSPAPLYLAGRRIIASYPFGPRTASAVNVTLMSLVDEMHLGINLDPAAVTDVALLIDCLDESFAALLDLAP